MKKLAILTLTVLLIFSCTSNNSKVEDIKALTLEELTVQAADLNEATISVEGLVTHVCKHGGQKMFLTDETKNIDILVQVSNSIPEFDVALEGSNVKVTGKVIVSVVDESMEEHEGEKEENCPTEEAMKKDGEACATNITYYIEAAEYSELK
ncbi:OB-fold nucleic acid binding domain-containing protein [Bacteroidota bacterium]